MHRKIERSKEMKTYLDHAAVTVVALGNKLK